MTFSNTFVTITLALIIGYSASSFANSDIKELFYSEKPQQQFALNSLRGKPPYNRAARNLQRRKQQEVEFSALEIVEEVDTNSTESNLKRLKLKGGHPDRMKRNVSYGDR